MRDKEVRGAEKGEGREAKPGNSTGSNNQRKKAEAEEDFGEQRKQEEEEGKG